MGQKTHRGKRAGHRAFLKGLKNELTSFGACDPFIFSARAQEQGATPPIEIPATPQQVTRPGHQEPEPHPRSLFERAAKPFKTILDFRKRAAKSTH